jgi:hypothetical protein
MRMSLCFCWTDCWTQKAVGFAGIGSNSALGLIMMSLYILASKDAGAACASRCQQYPTAHGNAVLQIIWLHFPDDLIKLIAPPLDFPAVKPSAIALGTIYTHGIELAVLSPLFGQTYQRAKASGTKEEFVKSDEATSAAVAIGTTFVGAALQSYGVGALINATGTLSYKGAAYLGALIFAATAAPSVSSPATRPR